jgi:1-pyrroline-5-carboxylate dehydrogenase
MTGSLPRVTYSNLGVDFSGVHTLLDKLIPEIQSKVLGKTWGNVIGAQTDDRSGKAYKVVSPIDSKILVGEFFDGNADTVDRAVGAALEAYKSWSTMPWQERLIRIRRWRDLVDAKKYELGVAALVEIGKSRMEAIGEAEECVDQIDYYAAEMERNEGFDRSLRQVLPGEVTKSILRPFGVFAVISPFNFPLALTINAIAAALIAGNTIVLKPSPGCALTGRLVIDTLLDAGIPGGVVNLVAGGDEAGRQLVRHAGVAGIAFVGSNAAGMSIYREVAANSRFSKPVIAEMGGKNPAYVTSSADLQRAASGVARSAFGLQGQKCSACSVAYVHTDIKNAFIDKLSEVTAGLKMGDPRDAAVFMGPTYNEAAFKRYEWAVAAAKKDGRILFGGDRLSGEQFDRGFYLKPTAVEVSGPGKLTRDELFMPFVAIRTFTDLAAAIDEGNDVEYGLAAGIYTADEKELKQFLNTTQAGVLYANRASGATTGAWPAIQSFCGWKGSGVSHKGGLGPHFLPQFMHEQSHTVIF